MRAVCHTHHMQIPWRLNRTQSWAQGQFLWISEKERKNKPTLGACVRTEDDDDCMGIWKPSFKVWMVTRQHNAASSPGFLMSCVPIQRLRDQREVINLWPPYFHLEEKTKLTQLESWFTPRLGPCRKKAVGGADLVMRGGGIRKKISTSKSHAHSGSNQIIFTWLHVTLLILYTLWNGET